MRRKPAHKLLSKPDVDLIIAVLDCAWRNDWPVARVVNHRLTQNAVALSMCIEDGDDDEYVVVSAETRRLVRLQRRFASWRRERSARPRSGHHRPRPSHHRYAAKA